jgi:hypothetical protein
MWAALLTVVALSLLISSAFAAYSTVLYFSAPEERDVDQNGELSIAPEEAAWFETDERDV